MENMEHMVIPEHVALILDGNGRCTKAALAFDAQCVEKVPAEAHDVRADYIITEKELIRCCQDCPETR